MALPAELGSCTSDFKLGSVDGSYKQVVKDRGGVVETLTYEARKDLSVSLYGIVECADKETPMSGPYRSPYAVRTPDPGIQVTHQSAV